MIIVIGNVVVKEHHLPEAIVLSQEHVRRSRAEAGCIAHAVHQDTENALRLVFVEQWLDRAALAEHFKVPASRSFAKAIAELAVEAPGIAIYDATQL
jgi:quinol monooxygenase YgiN